MLRSLFLTVFVLAYVTSIFADATDPVDFTPAGIPQEKSEAAQTKPQATAPRPQQPTRSFAAFTGKISKNKVRMRLQPNLDSVIIRELGPSDLVVVVGENDDFFAVEPPSDIRGYMYRTYVLDGVVEGNHVNVRLAPNLESPVVAQLNSGDAVSGKITPNDKKWLEISLPANTRFFIAKDYIEKIGDASLITTLKKKREEARALFAAASSESQTELLKPFNQINLDNTMQTLSKIITQYSEFPDDVSRAKELLNNIQMAYLNKKMAYLEARSKTAPNEKANPQPIVNANMPATPMPALDSQSNVTSSWIPIEDELFNVWSSDNDQASKEAFYQEQSQDATTLSGILEPYQRVVKNKPGDYLLINPATHLPVAYLYSTKVNLQDKVGSTVIVQVAPRDNNNFAYPAYFVLGIK